MLLIPSNDSQLMNPKWKLALFRCSNQKGFIIPTILGLGLVMILIGITMVVLSHDNQLTASSQKKSSEASNVAEGGVNEVLSFLSYKSNRLLTQIDLGAWDDPDCSNAPSDGLNYTRFVEDDPTNPGSKRGKWVEDINGGRDRYKIINYRYNADNKTGTLFVQAESNFADDVGKSSSFIQVTVPVSNTPTTNYPIPALWLKNAPPPNPVPQNLGNNRVNGNILVNKCPPLPNGITANNADAGEAKASKDILFPDTPPLPANNLIPVNNLDELGTNLPRPLDVSPTDLKQADGSYAYLIKGNLTTTGSKTIAIDNNKTVILYVQGNINLGGTPVINENGSSSQLQIYGNTPDNSLNPPYKYGCAAGVSCPTSQVNINGDGIVKALIHAPNATGAALTENTSNPKIRNFVGGVWVNRWNQQLDYNNPFLYGEGNYNDFLATKDSVGKPVIAAPITWQRCSSGSSSTCQQ